MLDPTPRPVPDFFTAGGNASRLVDRACDLAVALTRAERIEGEAVTAFRRLSVREALDAVEEKVAAIRAALGEGFGVAETPPFIGIAGAPDSVLASTLKTAIGHIEHMAAWIGKVNAGEVVGQYSFESIGEDMDGLKAALASATGAA